jgi:hypothetical protein
VCRGFERTGEQPGVQRAVGNQANAKPYPLAMSGDCKPP